VRGQFQGCVLLLEVVGSICLRLPCGVEERSTRLADIIVAHAWSAVIASSVHLSFSCMSWSRNAYSYEYTRVITCHLESLPTL
jgi:hypothetical protein